MTQGTKTNERPKLKKQRLTGLFRRSNKYGEFYTGTLGDGQAIIVHPPFEKKEGGPDLVLSALVPDDGTDTQK